MSEIHNQQPEVQEIDEEDKRQSFDDEMEWWILASST